MSKADIGIKERGGRNYVPTDRWIVNVNSGTLPLIEAGEPAKISTARTSSQHAILCVDGDMTIGTDKNMIGVAAGDSSESASAYGYGDFYQPLPDILWEIKEKTAAGADTQSEIDSFSGWAFVLDLTSGVFTFDLAGGTAAANAFVVTGGDPNRSMVHFKIRLDATVFGRDAV